jgi:hypothetical protein
VSGVDDLVAFVRARLNDREALLLHTRASDISCLIPISTLLAEVDARRERLLWIESELADDPTNETAQWLAKLEAQPHAGQHGWRKEWRADKWRD